MHEAILLVGGGALLTLGAELLVRGASRLALSLGVSPMVVGLTVVAFGTSTPELAASVAAQVDGKGGIALANIVGSNVANLALILAAAGLLAPLPVAAATIRRDLPILALTTLVFAAMLLHGRLGPGEGAFLLAGLAVLTWHQVRGALAERRAVREEYADAVSVKGRRLSPAACVAAVLFGLVLLCAGGAILVDGAVVLARRLGMTERVIGLTIVAVGTSLPELAATIIAVVRKEVDVAVGNVVGSNLFNILGIGGTVALVSPVSVPEEMNHLDTPVLAAATAAACLFLYSGRMLTRIEAACLLAGYVVYIVVVVGG